jgi:NCS1 family nucleobase:cation symporter-1
MTETMETADSSIEQITIHPVPLDQRTGQARHLFPIWFGVQIMPLTLITGVLGPTVFGLNLTWSIIAIVVGNLLGAIFMALHSAQGPRLGVPQMVQSRGQFGLYGSLLVLVIVILMYLGFLGSILVLAAQSLQLMFPSLGGTVAIIISSALTLVMVIFGYKVIHQLNRYLMPLFGLAVVATLWYILAARGSHDVDTSALGYNTTGMLGMLSVAAVWQLAYAPYVSDYSRYLPADIPARKTFDPTYLGTVTGAIPVMIVGALIPTVLGGAGSLNDLQGIMPSVSLFFIAMMFFLGSIDACVINLYGPALCLVTVGQTFKADWRPGAVTRGVLAAGFCFLAAFLATVFAQNFLVEYSNFILFLLYFLIPWSVVNLADYYIVRKGRYDVDSFFARDGGIYGLFDWPALIAYVLGVLCQIPFMSTTFYTGPVATALGGVDTAWIVGTIATLVIYLGLVRAMADKTKDVEFATSEDF